VGFKNRFIIISTLYIVPAGEEQAEKCMIPHIILSGQREPDTWVGKEHSGYCMHDPSHCTGGKKADKLHTARVVRSSVGYLVLVLGLGYASVKYRYGQ
jgi:hypothetical protein